MPYRLGDLRERANQLLYRVHEARGILINYPQQISYHAKAAHALREQIDKAERFLSKAEPGLQRLEREIRRLEEEERRHSDWMKQP